MLRSTLVCHAEKESKQASQPRCSPSFSSLADEGGELQLLRPQPGQRGYPLLSGHHLLLHFFLGLQLPESRASPPPGRGQEEPPLNSAFRGASLLGRGGKAPSTPPMAAAGAALEGRNSTERPKGREPLGRRKITSGFVRGLVCARAVRLRRLGVPGAGLYPWRRCG